MKIEMRLNFIILFSRKSKYFMQERSYSQNVGRSPRNGLLMRRQSSRRPPAPSRRRSSYRRHPPWLISSSSSKEASCPLYQLISTSLRNEWGSCINSTRFRYCMARRSTAQTTKRRLTDHTTHQQWSVQTSQCAKYPQMTQTEETVWIS
jgi:hypothetical protein